MLGRGRGESQQAAQESGPSFSLLSPPPLHGYSLPTPNPFFVSPHAHLPHAHNLTSPLCREWDTEITSIAIDIHDRLLRANMSRFFGYEVMTEVRGEIGRIGRERERCDEGERVCVCVRERGGV